MTAETNLGGRKTQREVIDGIEFDVPVGGMSREDQEDAAPPADDSHPGAPQTGANQVEFNGEGGIIES